MSRFIPIVYYKPFNYVNIPYSTLFEAINHGFLNDSFQTSILYNVTTESMIDIYPYLNMFHIEKLRKLKNQNMHDTSFYDRSGNESDSFMHVFTQLLILMSCMFFIADIFGIA